MYKTVIKHDGHLRTRGKCRKHEPQVSISSYTFLGCSQMFGVFYHSVKTQLRLLYLLYDIEVMWRITKKHTYPVLCSDKTGF